MSGAITAGTIATVAGIGAAGSIGAAAIGSNAAGNAASAQEKAANNAAQLQYQESQNALDFQKQQWNQTQTNMAPWLQMGGAGLGQLGYLMGLTPQTSLGGQTQVPNGINPSSIPASNAVSSPGRISPIQTGPTPTGGPMPSPGSNLALAGQSGAMGMVPANGVPSGVPAANPVSSQPLGSISAGPALSGGTVPRATPISNPAAGVDSGGSVAASPAGGTGGFGSLMTPYSGHFTAPTDITEQNDPGYQARLNLGTDAIQRSAAARGNVLTGGTGKALDSYAQDYASNEYNNVYNRALTGFTTDYNQYNNDQANQFNRLAAISGMGQTSAQQLANSGQNAANNVSSNLLGTGAQIGQDYNNAGAANASGIIGSANAWGGALGGSANNLQQLLLLKQLGLG